MNKADILNKIFELNRQLKRRIKKEEEERAERMLLSAALPDLDSCLQYIAQFVENADEEQLETADKVVAQFSFDIDNAKVFEIMLRIFLLEECVANLEGIDVQEAEKTIRSAKYEF